MKEPNLNIDAVLEMVPQSQYNRQCLHYSIMTTFGNIISPYDLKDSHLVRMVFPNAIKIIHLTNWAANPEIISKALEKAVEYKKMRSEDKRALKRRSSSEIKFLFVEKQLKLCQIEL